MRIIEHENHKKISEKNNKQNTAIIESRNKRMFELKQFLEQLPEASHLSGI